MNLALLGTLALVQIVFLPGYLLLRGLRLGGGLLATLVLSFALSLLANYLLVATLVVLGIYRPNVMYAIFVAETALWLLMDLRRLKSPIPETIAAARSRLASLFRDVEHDRSIRTPWLRRILVTAAVSVIGVFALASIAETGRIFDQWDAVVSWNRWAIDWAAGRLPHVTSYYPQLLPANISLTYVFMQSDEVWIFAKAMQFLFCVMLLLAMFDVAREPGNSGLMPGVVITYALLVAFLRYRMLSSGYADVPLAFFAWMPVYAIMLAGRARAVGWHQACETHQRGMVGLASSIPCHVILGAILAAGAALTKQTGLYVAAIYPVLAWSGLFLNRSARETAWQRVRDMARLYLLLAALIAPWYFYKALDIEADHDANNTAQLLNDYHEGRGVADRITHSGASILEATTVPGGALLLVALAASLGDRRARWLMGLIVVPIGLIWAAGFSYDLRNLAMLVPFLGMAAGIGFVRIVCWIEGTTRMRVDGRRQTADGESPIIYRPPSTVYRLPSTVYRLPFFGSFRVWHVVLPLVAVLLACTLRISNDTLLASQRSQQRRVGVVSLNEQLYSFIRSRPDMDLIATDYLALPWLPGFEQRSIGCSCCKLAEFRRAYDLPNIRYILVRSAGQAADVHEFLARPAEVRLLFEEHGFAFYEKAQIVRPICYNRLRTVANDTNPKR